MCQCSQALTASTWLREWPEFWAAASARMEQLGYNKFHIGTLKALLLQQALPVSREFFEGDDCEVQCAVNALLMPSGKCTL